MASIAAPCWTHLRLLAIFAFSSSSTHSTSEKLCCPWRDLHLAPLANSISCLVHLAVAGDDEYPFHFHPLKLGDAALKECFGCTSRLTPNQIQAFSILVEVPSHSKQAKTWLEDHKSSTLTSTKAARSHSPSHTRSSAPNAHSHAKALAAAPHRTSRRARETSPSSADRSSDNSAAPPRTTP